MSKPNEFAMAVGMKRRNKRASKENGAIQAKIDSNPLSQKLDAREATRASMDERPKMAKGGLVNFDTESRPMPKKGMQTTAIKHPKMVPSSVFSSRLRDEEDHLQSTAAVNDGPQRQPPQEDNEMDATKEGPSVPALKMKKMAEGGMINEDVSMHDAEEDMVDHPAGLESDDDMMGDEDAMDDHMTMFAEGGLADDVMKRRDSSIHSSDSMDTTDDSQVDLSRNADEDANMEDQSSFEALRKENYSETAGLDHMDQPHDSNLHGHTLSDEDAHDLVNTIRSKLRKSRVNGNR